MSEPVLPQLGEGLDPELRQELFDALAKEHQALFRLTESGTFLTPARGGNDFAVLEVHQSSS